VCVILRYDRGKDQKSLEEELTPWTPYIPEKPSRILSGFHAKEEGKFWLSMVSVVCCHTVLSALTHWFSIQLVTVFCHLQTETFCFWETVGELT